MLPFSALFREAFSARADAFGRNALYDPTGWGRCVCPIFADNDQVSVGWGTGFFVKRFGFGITAEHLIDVESMELPLAVAGAERALDLSQVRHGLTAMLPSQSVVFGTTHLPQPYLQSARQFIFDITKKDDPSAELRGNRRFAPASDVMFLRFDAQASLPPADWLPRVSGRIPEVGEWVCAVGFPDIKLRRLSDAINLIRNEGMAISFARVTQVSHTGRGRYDQSPIAFVESDWPGGMSGGPVFNDTGRVVGVVSRELPSDGSGPSSGSFTCLAAVLRRYEQYA